MVDVFDDVEDNLANLIYCPWIHLRIMKQLKRSNYRATNPTHVFKADRLQMIVVAKKYICVATVHQ